LRIRLTRHQWNQLICYMRLKLTLSDTQAQGGVTEGLESTEALDITSNMHGQEEGLQL